MPAELRVVGGMSEESEAAQMLRKIVPTLRSVEETAARMRQHQAAFARELAKERGVAFIREEQLRREFGE